jgi:hypothetical protein
MPDPAELPVARPTSIIDVADPRRSAEVGTVGLTVAHALVRFLADQCSERDEVEHRHGGCPLQWWGPRICAPLEGVRGSRIS